jgi:hypothetical protein
MQTNWSDEKFGKKFSDDYFTVDFLSYPSISIFVGYKCQRIETILYFVLSDEVTLIGTLNVDVNVTSVTSTFTSKRATIDDMTGGTSSRHFYAMVQTACWVLRTLDCLILNNMFLSEEASESFKEFWTKDYKEFEDDGIARYKAEKKGDDFWFEPSRGVSNS